MGSSHARNVSSTRRLWLALGVVVIASFAVLGYFGREIYRQAPPVPKRVVTADGRVLFTGRDQGRPERLAVDGRPGGRHDLGPRRLRRAGLVGRLAAPRGDLAARPLGRRPSTASLTTSCRRRDAGRAAGAARSERSAPTPTTRRPATWSSRRSRAEAIAAVGAHYAALFGDDPALASAARRLRHPGQRDQDPGAPAALNAFFFWTSWACAHRPARAATITYTNNWPPEALIDNRPTGADRRLVGRQLHRCCWPASARWPGTSPSSATSGEEEHDRARRATRCWRSSRRRRCGRR